MRRIAATCLAGGIFAVTAGASSVPAATVAPCTVRHRAIVGVRASRVLLTSGPVVVYRTRGFDADAYSACRRGGKSVVIGYDDTYQAQSGEYGPSTTLGGIHVAGDWIVATLETGADLTTSCEKYMQYPCPGPSDTIVVANVALRRTGRLVSIASLVDATSGYSTGSSFARTLLSPQGGVVWLTDAPSYQAGSARPPGLYGCRPSVGAKGRLGCSARLLTQDAIDPLTVRLDRTTVTWTWHGQPQSASV
jgi:hypothetical protein